VISVLPKFSRQVSLGRRGTSLILDSSRPCELSHVSCTETQIVKSFTESYTPVT
jgi:hypothetical protein